LGARISCLRERRSPRKSRYWSFEKTSRHLQQECEEPYEID
jgi:hypothetical protein